MGEVRRVTGEKGKEAVPEQLGISIIGGQSASVSKGSSFLFFKDLVLYSYEWLFFIPSPILRYISLHSFVSIISNNYNLF